MGGCMSLQVCVLGARLHIKKRSSLCLIDKRRLLFRG